MRKSFGAGTCGEGELKRLAGLLQVGRKKLGKGTGHKPTKEVTDHYAPDTAIWLLQRHDAAKANGGGDAGGNLRPCEISGCSDESKTRCFVIQNKAAQLRGVATGARCCSFTGAAQVCKERVGGERDRGLRLEFQKRRV